VAGIEQHPGEVLGVMSDSRRFNGSLGLGKLLESVGWSRVLEYAYAVSLLRASAGGALLDVGTGRHSIFPLFCAWRFGVRAIASDLDAESLARQRRWAQRAGMCGEASRGGLETERVDARAVPHPDGSLDCVSAISSIEHIPGDGDSTAVREAHRVLRPGGAFVCTVPFDGAAQEHAEMHRKRSAYDRDYKGQPVFFQHVYCWDSLRSRILEAAPFKDWEVILLGRERGGLTEFWQRHVPFRNTLKYLLGWALTRDAMHGFRLARHEPWDRAIIAVCRLNK